jgi:hypothetical protein
MFNFTPQRVNGKDTFLKVFWLYNMEGTGNVNGVTFCCVFKEW